MNDIRLNTGMVNLEESRAEKVLEQKKETAMEFERIFSRHLVQELTKGSFKTGDSYGSSSFKMYRNHIVDTLANELASQRKLGMADMLMKHWDLPINTDK